VEQNPSYENLGMANIEARPQVGETLHTPPYFPIKNADKRKSKANWNWLENQFCSELKDKLSAG
jgi:hypothetical protein